MMREEFAMTSRSHRRAAGIILVVGLLALAPVNTASAAEAAYLTISSKALGSTQSLELGVNKSMIVDLPVNVGEVIASQPNVATVVMRSKTRAIVQGISGGDTNVFFLDTKGNNITVLDLKIFQPRSDVGNALEAASARTIPGSHISVESVSLDGTTSRVVLTGTAVSQDDVARAQQIAVQFAGDAANVANIVTVAGNQQVKLQVIVAEVNRQAIKQFGINLSGSITVGAVDLSLESQNPNGNVSGVTNSNGVTANVSAGPASLEATLNALERRGSLRTLAKPVLSAISGQPAEFKAGGDFPFTQVVDGKQSTEFKEYGVFLNFTPTVKSNGQIQLLVDTAVKEPSGGGGVTNRSAKTTVEMRAGETLAIAGMLQDTVKQQINQLPGIGNVPILGALFRSRDFIHSATELVILVTPYMTAPGYNTDTPADGFVVAGDAEAIFLGQMEAKYGVSGSDGLQGSYQGSVGFVLD
jgi:pilus assembly protein CpaC